MKTYEEMANSALERIEKNLTERKKRRKKITVIVLPVLTLAIVAMLGIGIMQSVSEPVQPGLTGTLDTEKPEVKEKVVETTEKTDEKTEEKREAQFSLPSAMTEDNCLFIWKNKLSIGGVLYEMLQNDTGCVYKVKAAYRPATSEITSFVYNGKTLSDWAVAAYEERLCLDRMIALVKVGDSLRYGEALCTTGDADGKVWDRRHYETTLTTIGKDLLEKYLVNGEFLKEKLEKDIEEMKEYKAEKCYAEAWSAYMNSFMPSQEAKLKENGIEYERCSEGLIISVTALQLENIPFDNIASWYFTSYTEGVQTTDNCTVLA